jgi:hypothetical protein
MFKRQNLKTKLIDLQHMLWLHEIVKFELRLSLLVTFSIEALP